MSKSVVDLAGLGHATGLVKAYLADNKIDDLTPLADLAALKELYIVRNPMTDISPLAKLPLNLEKLSLYVSWLLVDISPLAVLTKLEFLDAGRMVSADYSSVSSLAALKELHQNNGFVWDASFLLGSQWLESSRIEMYNNPLGCAAVATDIPTLRDRGATVEVDSLPAAVPQSPKKLKRGKNKVMVSWKSHRGEAITIYEVRYAEDSEDNFGDWDRVAYGDRPSTGYVVGALDDDARYFFQVRDVNTAGCGEVGQIATEPEAVAPTADAGNDQTVTEDGKAQLDGSGSSAPEDQILTYSWRQSAGRPLVTIERADTATPYFATPNLVAPAKLTFELTVTAAGASATDAVDVTIDADNDPPMARAGRDRTVAEEGAGSLDAGASSDPEGEPLAYSWRQSGGEPTLTLTDANTATPSFATPNLVAPTTLTFELTATASGASTTDTVNVTIDADNDPPTASAGKDQTVAAGGSGRLDGGASSDPEGESLDYSWRQSAGEPSVALAESRTATPSFKAPSVTTNATLTFELTVTAGGASATDTVDVTIGAASPTVSIADGHLLQCVEKALQKEAGEPITEAEMSTLTRLLCGRVARVTTFADQKQDVRQVASLAGLEHATGLVELGILGHAVSDLSPLAGLASLRHLAASSGAVKDLSPLANLVGLTELYLGANGISDVSPLAGLTSLRSLGIGANDISDISALAGLTSLTYLAVYSNSIADISAIARMTGLERLYMSDNAVRQGASFRAPLLLATCAPAAAKAVSSLATTARARHPNEHLVAHEAANSSKKVAASTFA